MMKEEKGNIEQMSERLFHYLRKRESSASQEAEDEVWSKISEQIDKKKHIPVYRWLIPVTAVAAASLLFVFWLNIKLMIRFIRQMFKSLYLLQILRRNILS